MYTTLTALLCLILSVNVFAGSIKIKNYSLTQKAASNESLAQLGIQDSDESLSLRLEYLNEETDEEKEIGCDDLRPLPPEHCPVSENVRVTLYRNGQVIEEEGNTCSTYTTPDNRCVVTKSEDGFYGLKYEDNIPITFKVSYDCRDEECQSIQEGGSVPSCGVEDQAHDHLEELMHPGANPNLPLWEGCYPGIEKTTTVYLGIAVGYKLFQRLKSKEKVLKYIESMVADTNSIYLAQLNLGLVVRHVLILEEDTDTVPWSNKGCQYTINQHFSRFASFQKPSSQAAWHMFDDCYQSGQAIGLAYVGGMCSSSNTVTSTISYYSRSMWITFAHEMGHNIGSQHSFEEGVGKTGGIMDYGNKQLNGYYQFNKKYRYKNICPSIAKRFEGDKCNGKVDRNPEKSAVCGNGEVEFGEQCECADGAKDCPCCSSCRLKPAAKCSPLSNQCCDNQCEFKGTEGMCDTSTGKGYCNNGFCQNSVCGLLRTDSCGTLESNSCKIQCVISGVCNPMNGWTISGRPLNHIPNGSLCTKPDGDRGECQEGNCVDKVIPTPTPDPCLSETPLLKLPSEKQQYIVGNDVDLGIEINRSQTGCQQKDLQVGIYSGNDLIMKSETFALENDEATKTLPLSISMVSSLGSVSIKLLQKESIIDEGQVSLDPVVCSSNGDNSSFTLSPPEIVLNANTTPVTFDLEIKNNNHPICPAVNYKLGARMNPVIVASWDIGQFSLKSGESQISVLKLETDAVEGEFDFDLLMDEKLVGKGSLKIKPDACENQAPSIQVLGIDPNGKKYIVGEDTKLEIQLNKAENACHIENLALELISEGQTLARIDKLTMLAKETSKKTTMTLQTDSPLKSIGIHLVHKDQVISSSNVTLIPVTCDQSSTFSLSPKSIVQEGNASPGVFKLTTKNNNDSLCPEVKYQLSASHDSQIVSSWKSATFSLASGAEKISELSLQSKVEEGKFDFTIMQNGQVRENGSYEVKLPPCENDTPQLSALNVDASGIDYLPGRAFDVGFKVTKKADSCPLTNMTLKYYSGGVEVAQSEAFSLGRKDSAIDVPAKIQLDGASSSLEVQLVHEASSLSSTSIKLNTVSCSTGVDKLTIDMSPTSQEMFKNNKEVLYKLTSKNNNHPLCPKVESTYALEIDPLVEARFEGQSLSLKSGETKVSKLYLKTSAKEGEFDFTVKAFNRNVAEGQLKVNKAPICSKKRLQVWSKNKRAIFTPTKTGVIKMVVRNPLKGHNCRLPVKVTTRSYKRRKVSLGISEFNLMGGKVQEVDVMIDNVPGNKPIYRPTLLRVWVNGRLYRYETQYKDD